MIGKVPPPRPGEPTATLAESVPDEEHIDPGRIEEDLEQFED